MWKIKEVKQRGKKLLKNNLWTLIFVGIFMGFIIGEYTVTRDGFSNIKSLRNVITDIKYGNTENIKDKESKLENILSDILYQTASGDVINLNEKFNVTKGTFYIIFNQLAKQQMQVHNLIKSISNYFTRTQMEALMLMFAAIAGVLIKIFISNPIYVGESRVYLESGNYKKTRFKKLAFAFKGKRYLHCVSTIFLKNWTFIPWMN